MLHPHAIGVGLSSPPSLLLLASWRSLSWSLKRDTLCEMATYLVTETICRRRSLTILFLAIDPPSLSPRKLAANWSINKCAALYLDAHKASTSKSGNFLTPFVKGHVS